MFSVALTAFTHAISQLLTPIRKEAEFSVICTHFILYKGFWNFKSRGIPLFFQNFDSFYPLFFTKSLNFSQFLPFSHKFSYPLTICRISLLFVPYFLKTHLVIPYR